MLLDDIATRCSASRWLDGTVWQTVTSSLPRDVYRIYRPSNPERMCDWTGKCVFQVPSAPLTQGRIQDSGKGWMGGGGGGGST